MYCIVGWIERVFLLWFGCNLVDFLNNWRSHSLQSHFFLFSILGVVSYSFIFSSYSCLSSSSLWEAYVAGYRFYHSFLSMNVLASWLKFWGWTYCLFHFFSVLLFFVIFVKASRPLVAFRLAWWELFVRRKISIIFLMQHCISICITPSDHSKSSTQSTIPSMIDSSLTNYWYFICMTSFRNRVIT